MIQPGLFACLICLSHINSFAPLKPPVALDRARIGIGAHRERSWKGCAFQDRGDVTTPPKPPGSSPSDSSADRLPTVQGETTSTVPEKRSPKRPKSTSKSANSVGRTKRDASDPGATEVTIHSLPGTDRSVVRRAAQRFRELLQQGRVQLLNSDREQVQIERLCLAGAYAWTPSRAPVVSGPLLAEASPIDLPGPDIGDLTSSPRGRASRHFSDDTDRGPVSGSQQPAPDAAAPAKPSAAVRVSYITEPPEELFLMLNCLASHSSPKQPFVVMSLMRAPAPKSVGSTHGVTNPHALGLAVDIAAFGGHKIVTSDPEEEVQACLALLKCLAPGRYRMGLPRAPDLARPPATVTANPDALNDVAPPPDQSDSSPTGRSTGRPSARGGRTRHGSQQTESKPNRAVDANPDDQQLTSEPTVAPWPFFPAPQKVVDSKGRSTLKFANSHYVDEQYLNDPRLKTAFEEARRRGVDVFALFPDGVNHIHVDVRQIP